MIYGTDLESLNVVFWMPVILFSLGILFMWGTVKLDICRKMYKYNIEKHVLKKEIRDARVAFYCMSIVSIGFVYWMSIGGLNRSLQEIELQDQRLEQVTDFITLNGETTIMLSDNDVVTIVQDNQIVALIQNGEKHN